MKSKQLGIIAFIALVIIGNWISRRVEYAAAPSLAVRIHPQKPPPQAATEPPPPPSSTARPDPATPPPRTEASRAASERDFTNPLVPSYDQAPPHVRRAENSEPEVAVDFDNITLMLRAYHDLAGENPVGTNAEIMKAVMGENPRNAQLGPPDGQTLNGAGELIDRWGTPYFFHQLSKDLMEIHSAGPDRRMGTQDDIVGN